MNVLVDTQLALWTIVGDRRLGEAATSLMTARGVRKYVSAVTVWEISIKHALGPRRRDPILLSGARARELFKEAGFLFLPVSAEHAAAADDLPPIHGDPFDRMLVAQALTEPMRLLTRDMRLREYGVLVQPA